MTDLDPTTVEPTPAAPETAPSWVAAPGGDPAQGPYEPAFDAAPASPVQAPASALRRRPVRWPVAIALIALILAVSAFVGVLVTGRAPNAKVLGYVPADSIVYGEARLDLPGDQRLNLASFLSKFPGFADQSAIESKLYELMDRVVGGATSGGQTYTGNIQPWFDGELAFSLGALPDPAALAPGHPGGIQPRVLVLLSVKDPAGATEWFRKLAGTTSVTLSDTTYAGTPLVQVTDASGSQGGFAVLDNRVAVAGDIESVKAAVDTKGAGPFASEADPRTALEATDSDHLAFVYVALRPLMDWSMRLSQTIQPSASSGLSTELLDQYIPAWGAFALRVEGDALVLENAAPKASMIPASASNGTSTVADHVPVTALAALIARDYGKGVAAALDTYRTSSDFKPMMDQVDQIAGLLGGVDGAIGWIGDTAIVVNQASDSLDGGLIIQPTDRAKAEQVLTSLRNLAALGGGPAGITVTDESYAGATITTVDLGEIESLLGSATAGASVFGRPGVLPAGHVQLAYAITDQVVVLGAGPGFVKHVLDTTATSSLGASDRYRSLINRVGSGTGSMFVDLAAIRALAESSLGSLPQDAGAQYNAEIQPYLAPFDALVTSGSVKDDLSLGKVLITVK